MDPKELREKSLEELREEEQRLRRELFDLEFKNGTRQLLDTASITKAKRDIARVLTVLNEKNRAEKAQASA